MSQALLRPVLPTRCTSRDAACSPRCPNPVASLPADRRETAATVHLASLHRRRCRKELRQICHAETTAATDIKLVCLDVDGTLLDSKAELTPAVEEAIQAARQAGVQVILATGKAPCGPWMEGLTAKLGSKLPGVFMLGLVLHGSDGRTTYTRSLDNSLCEDILSVGKRFKLTTVAYCNERIFIEDTDHSESFQRQGEPEPTHVPDLKDILKAYDIQKIVYAGEDDYLREVRPRIAEALTSRAPRGRSGSGGGYAQSGETVTMTMSQPHQLQLLPPGQSKAVGVGRLLKQLDVQPAEMMAVGDSESDIEILKMAGLSVAMGNASEQVKDVCHETTLSNNEDGVAAALRKFVLEPRGL